MSKLINDKIPLELPNRCYEKTQYGNGCVYPTCIYLDVAKKKCELNLCIRKDFIPDKEKAVYNK